MLSQSWKEGLEGQINLPEDAHETVNLYLLYLYSNKLHIDWTTTAKDLPENNLLPEYITLARLYVFGEKIGDVSFKNAIVRSMLKRMGMGLNNNYYNAVGEAVYIIYKGTPPGSRMRKLLVDNMVVSGREAWIGRAVDDNSAEFLVGLSCALLKCRACPEDRLRVADVKDGRYEEAVGTQIHGPQ